MSVENKRRSEGRQDPLANDHCVGRLPRILEDDDELIAAQPANAVAQADAHLQPQRNLLQQQIADVVTERIVHVLEPVEVDEHHRHFLFVALRAARRLLQAVVQQASVRHTGQRIEACELLELALRFLQQRDIGEYPHVIAESAVGVAHGGGGDPERQWGPVLTDARDFRGNEAITKLPIHPRHRFGNVNRAEWRLSQNPAHDLLRVVAGELRERGVDHDYAIIGIADHDGVGRCFEDLRGKLQLVHTRALLRDVGRTRHDVIDLALGAEDRRT